MKINKTRRMSTRISSLSVSIVLIASAGCNLCCPPYLDDYATVGGKWARANPTEGRVGSAFSDPGIIGSTVDLSNNLVYPQTDGNQQLESAPPTTPMPPVSEPSITLGDDW